MSIAKLCQAPCCCRPREQGSKYCSVHREKCEARDKAREEERAKKRFQNYKANPDHAAYWQSSRWKRLSKELLKEHPYCTICGRSDIRLNVHHFYKRGYDYFNETDFYDRDRLMVVCTACHEQLTHSNRLDNVAEQSFRFDFRKNE